MSNLPYSEYNTTPVVRTSGEVGPLQSDADGNLKVTVADSAAGVVDESAMPATPTFTPVGGEYRASATTYTDGDATVLQTDINGNLKNREAYAPAAEDNTNGVMAYVRKPLASPTYAPSLYAPLTQVTKANIKASAGNVFSVYVTNDNAAVRFLLLHNKATAPAAAEAPVYAFKIPAGTANNPGVLILDEAFFARGGAHFATGIGFSISTTFATFTDSATASEHIINVHYI